MQGGFLRSAEKPNPHSPYFSHGEGISATSVNQVHPGSSLAGLVHYPGGLSHDMQMQIQLVGYDIPACYSIKSTKDFAGFLLCPSRETKPSIIAPLISTVAIMLFVSLWVITNWRATTAFEKRRFAEMHAEITCKAELSLLLYRKATTSSPLRHGYHGLSGMGPSRVTCGSMRLHSK